MKLNPLYLPIPRTRSHTPYYPYYLRRYFPYIVIFHKGIADSTYVHVILSLTRTTATCIFELVLAGKFFTRTYYSSVMSLTSLARMGRIKTNNRFSTSICCRDSVHLSIFLINHLNFSSLRYYLRIDFQLASLFDWNWKYQWINTVKGTNFKLLFRDANYRVRILPSIITG